MKKFILLVLLGFSAVYSINYTPVLFTLDDAKQTINITPGTPLDFNAVKNNLTSDFLTKYKSGQDIIVAISDTELLASGIYFNAGKCSSPTFTNIIDTIVAALQQYANKKTIWEPTSANAIMIDPTKPATPAENQIVFYTNEFKDAMNNLLAALAAQKITTIDDAAFYKAIDYIINEGSISFQNTLQQGDTNVLSLTSIVVFMAKLVALAIQDCCKGQCTYAISFSNCADASKYASTIGSYSDTLAGITTDLNNKFTAWQTAQTNLQNCIKNGDSVNIATCCSGMTNPPSYCSSTDSTFTTLNYINADQLCANQFVCTQDIINVTKAQTDLGNAIVRLFNFLVAYPKNMSSTNSKKYEYFIANNSSYASNCTTQNSTTTIFGKNITMLPYYYAYNWTGTAFNQYMYQSPVLADSSGNAILVDNHQNVFFTNEGDPLQIDESGNIVSTCSANQYCTPISNFNLTEDGSVLSRCPNGKQCLPYMQCPSDLPSGMTCKFMTIDDTKFVDANGNLLYVDSSGNLTNTASGNALVKNFWVDSNNTVQTLCPAGQKCTKFYGCPPSQTGCKIVAGPNNIPASFIPALTNDIYYTSCLVNQDIAANVQLKLQQCQGVLNITDLQSLQQTVVDTAKQAQQQAQQQQSTEQQNQQSMMMNMVVMPVVFIAGPMIIEALKDYLLKPVWSKIQAKLKGLASVAEYESYRASGLELDQYKDFRNNGWSLDEFAEYKKAGTDFEGFKHFKEKGLSLSEYLEFEKSGFNLDDFFEAKTQGLSLQKANNLKDQGISLKEFGEGTKLGLSESDIAQLKKSNISLDEFAAIKAQNPGKTIQNLIRQAARGAFKIVAAGLGSGGVSVDPAQTLDNIKQSGVITNAEGAQIKVTDANSIAIANEGAFVKDGNSVYEVGEDGKPQLMSEDEINELKSQNEEFKTFAEEGGEVRGAMVE